MRQSLLAFLLLASLPVASASAETFALYHSPSGNIAFHGVSGGFFVTLLSASGRINYPNVESLPIETTPDSDALVFVSSKPSSAHWVVNPRHPFDFNVLKVNGAVLPNTPIGDLTFQFHPSTSTAAITKPIFQIPEPSPFVIAAIGMFAISLTRRRHLPAP